MSLFDPRLDVELVLKDRWQLINRSEDTLGRRLLFKARTLKILEINGERILDGQVIVHDERAKGRNAWEGRDLPGAISYFEAHEGESAFYEVKLWLDGPAFEDLRTCDLSSSIIELYADAGAGANPDALKRGDRPYHVWDANLTSDLVLDRTTIWIKPKTEDSAESEKPPQEMTSFQRQVLEMLRAHGQTVTWMFYLLVGIFTGLLIMGRGCR